MPNSGRKFKNHVYEQVARIGKALASPQRLEILDFLSQGVPRTVESLAREVHLSVANTSRHLQILRAARLVETEKEGVFVYYRLVDETVADLYRTLRVLAHSRLAELEQITRHYFQGRDALEPINRKTLLARAKKGQVIVLDVRPAEEYQAGHLPHARSIPLGDLEERLSELPQNTEIVAYCRGPYCVLSGEAVALLRDKGFQAVRLEDNVQDWRAHGLPVSTKDTP